MKTCTIELAKNVLDEMNRILALPTGLKDTKAGDTIQCFGANFDNGFQADIKVCNGDDEGSPWIDCVLFDKNGREITCFVSEDYQLNGEYEFIEGDEEYVVIIKEAR